MTPPRIPSRTFTAAFLASLCMAWGAAPAPQPQPQGAVREVVHLSFDQPEQQELARLGKGSGGIRIEDGAGNPGRAICLRGSARFDFTQPVTTRPGLTYLVSWDCRTKDVTGMALAASATDNKRNPADGVAQAGTTGWVRHEFVFTGDGRPVTLTLGLLEGGSAWFDNLVVQEFETYPKRTLLSADACFIVGNDPAATVWVSYPPEKIFPDDPPPEGIARRSAIELDVAGNEREALELVISPAQKPLGVELAISDLHGPKTLDARCWTTHRVAYVDVPASSIGVPYGRPGPNPDPLPRANSLQTGQGSNGVFWITVSAPAGCRPGVYEGKLTLRGGITCDIPLRLRVRNFSLPQKPTVSSQVVYRETPSP